MTEPSTRTEVSCPECGTPAEIAPNRRDSADFCAGCDYPLFWTPTAVVGQETLGAADAALRRLPGTAGRVTVASATCPTCAETNPLAAEFCVRCGGPMQLPQPEPEPVPVVLAPPPQPEPEPPWWDPWVPLMAVLIPLLALVAALLTG